MNLENKISDRTGDDHVAKTSRGRLSFSDFFLCLLNFFAINFCVLALMALCFLSLIPGELARFIMTSDEAWVSYGFVSLALIGQVGMMGLLAALLITGLVMALRAMGRRIDCDRVLVWSVAFFMSGVLIWMSIDFAVYRLIGYHLAGTFWTVLFSGAFFQVIVLSRLEWLALTVGFFFILGCEVMLARLLWRRGPFRFLWHVFFVMVAGIGVAFGAAYAFYFSNPVPSRDIPQLAKVVPYFDQVASVLHRPKTRAHFVYPSHALVFRPVHHPMNVLMIVIDTWRADQFSEEVTPNIADFALHSLRFVNHYSGGNFTQPGVFSLLYGLTPNYWYTMRYQQRGPALIHQLLQDHYALAILPSASPRFPDFIDTAFRDVPSAWSDTLGIDSTERDATITNEFQQFLTTRNPTQPFFGFLFYDEVHNWCGSHQPYPTPFEPSIKVCNHLAMSGTTNPLPYLNRYENAVHYDDQLIGNILNQLKQSGVLNHTIVIITADHGEEFNDSHRNVWGHGSAFDQYQLHVPFILYWPHKAPQVMTYRTSHYDIVPTLMTDVLGCQNPMKDYSDGVSLFSVVRPRYILVGSDERYAKLFTRSVEITYPGGYNTSSDLDGRSM